MSALGFQEALARVLVDPAARAQLDAGESEAIRSRHALTEEEIAQMRELVHGENGGFEFFAGLLAAKRAARIAASLPLTRGALGERDWGTAWQAYARARRPEAALRVAADARAFGTFLREAAVLSAPLPARVADLVVYECAKLEVASAPGGANANPSAGAATSSAAVGRCYPLLRQPSRLLRVEHELVDAVRAINAGEPMAHMREAPAWILVYRRPRGAVATARVGDALVATLRRCDGTLTASELAGDVAAARLAEFFGRLAVLAERGALDLLPAPVAA